ncbi:hypothetical protein [Ruminococcus flavefaciens]|uniref:Uncharacterized protein n=1 Tax=Ruminococcus flavefaciens TaxID=1265 RepID=A0A1M7GIK6_RUMFL|nr:hypothetical protein [Ruminococcus flavefaciens]SHM16224.1 hypothetical protein SAMN04487860_101332 [Ruminococcus flavefaciens]
MGNEIYFKTALGGYNKDDVLAKIDAYTCLITAIDSAIMSDAAINAELLKIRHMPMKKAKCLFLPASGFSIRDVDEYIRELEKEIANKVML